MCAPDDNFRQKKASELYLSNIYVFIKLLAELKRKKYGSDARC